MVLFWGSGEVTFGTESLLGRFWDVLRELHCLMENDLGVLALSGSVPRYFVDRQCEKNTLCLAFCWQ